MKRIVMFVSAIAMFVACNSGREFIVEGTVANADDGEIVCLTYPVERDGIWYQHGRWSHITPSTISEIERIIGSVK